ncbi:ATP-binding protein [Clostridium sp. AF43-10]|nr:ATP-binding protein [Clostridium sp. AF43-10]
MKIEKFWIIISEIYVDIDEDREILDYYISFEIKDDGRIYITEERLSRKNGNYSKNSYLCVFDITEERLSRKNGNYSKNSYLCVFESKDGALEKFGNDKVYEFVKEKTLNLLDKQSFASSILTMMNDFPHDKDLNNDFVTVIELFAFAISLNVCIDNADIHTNNRLYQKIQSIEENKKDSFTKETFNQLKREILEASGKREILEASGRDILVPKNLYSSYEEQIAKLSMFIQIFKPELVNIEVDKKDFDQFYKCNLKMINIEVDKKDFDQFYKCNLKMIYENYTLDQEFESRGIKKMMDLFYYLEDACMGMITFIDELDSNINDVYLDKIIEYFILYGKGQLCFTSHNLSPMSVLKKNKNAITFISSVNTVHTWANNGNLSPENAYKNGFIEDSPFNVDASDFLGILGGTDE